MDSNKDKQCTLEDDFLVATGLVGNECGGGDNDCADSKNDEFTRVLGSGFVGLLKFNLMTCPLVVRPALFRFL